MNDLPQGASVWLRVTVIDTDVWTSEVGSPITTFETPCGETFCVFSEGLEIVPVSPVRADREAVVEVILAANRSDDGWMIDEHGARVIADAVLAWFRATPEPERDATESSERDAVP